jgi:hypothetical protein
MVCVRAQTELPVVIISSAWKEIWEVNMKKKLEEKKTEERKQKWEEAAKSLVSHKQCLCYVCAFNIMPGKDKQVQRPMCNKLFYEKCMPRH